MDNFHLVIVLKPVPESSTSAVAPKSNGDEAEAIVTEPEFMDFSGSDPRTVILFRHKRSTQLQQQSPWMSHGDINRRVYDDWRTMDDKARREYVTSQNDPEITKIQEAIKTKDYSTSPALKAAYLCFRNKKYTQMKKENPQRSHVEIDQMIYDQWHKTDFFTRQKYIQEKPEAEKLSTYQTAISDQNTKMDKYSHAKEEVLRRENTKKTTIVKNPVSSYLYYCAERRPQLKEMDPNMLYNDVTATIHFEWKEMDTEARKKYTDLAAKDKARYKKEKDTYKGKKEKDPNAPRRPLSEYLYYANERRPSLKKEDPTLSFIDATKRIAAEWKIMTPLAREKWTKLAAADNDRYTHEKANYIVNKIQPTHNSQSTTLI